MILLDGVHLYNYGGLIILNRIVKELDSNELKYKVILDHRHQPRKNTIILNKGFLSRYFFYKKNKNQFSKILCLGNVPPPIKCDAKVYLFFHNINLLIKNDVLTLIKRTIIKFHISNIDEIIVQTQLVKKTILKKINVNCIIHIHPVFDKSFNKLKSNKKLKNKKLTFLYPASLVKHKNHKLLFDYFNKFNRDYILLLTISNLTEHISNKIEINDNIYNLGLLPNNEIMEILNNVDALIFTSKSESFGLPLVEAALLKKPILSIDLPYVNEIISTPYRFEKQL
ncbi:glycosyltransferase [Flavobacteriales bacterium]|nr:glycosyltransferase [Flavobacteriales bacterium]